MLSRLSRSGPGHERYESTYLGSQIVLSTRTGFQLPVLEALLPAILLCSSMMRQRRSTRNYHLMACCKGGNQW